MSKVMVSTNDAFHEVKSEICTCILGLLIMERVNISIEEAKKEPNNWDFEFAYSKLEQLGYRIGLGIIERMVLNLPYTANRMEYAKFICEVFWTSFFGGKMDMSDTEDEDRIVFTDRSFKWFNGLTSIQVESRHLDLYLALPCGLLRGAFENFGWMCVFEAQISQFPECVFKMNPEI